MKTKSLIISMLVTFAITLLVTMLVTLFWNFFIDKSGANVDWRTSFVLAIIMGIVIPISHLKK